MQSRAHLSRVVVIKSCSLLEIEDIIHVYIDKYLADFGSKDAMQLKETGREMNRSPCSKEILLVCYAKEVCLPTLQPVRRSHRPHDLCMVLLLADDTAPG